MINKIVVGDKIFESEVVPKKYKKRKNNWKKLYYFKKRKKTEIIPKNITTDKIITSALQYQVGVFYKISQESERDEYFDYYFILKEDAPQTILKPTRRHHKKTAWKYERSNEFELDECGNIVLTFD